MFEVNKTYIVFELVIKDNNAGAIITRTTSTALSKPIITTYPQFPVVGR